MLYVVETDAPCTKCGLRHEYATKGCFLVVLRDPVSARILARRCDGKVREIERVPEDVHYILFTHIDGRPDPALPRTREKLA